MLSDNDIEIIAALIDTGIGIAVRPLSDAIDLHLESHKLVSERIKRIEDRLPEQFKKP